MSKPMTNSMGKEELKDRLDDWKHDVDEFGLLHHDGWDDVDEHAYAQLVEIVEGHFLDPGVKTEILAQEYEKGLQDGYEHAKKELADPVENNKTDTQEGVEE